jgi:hypothetical protein
LRWVICKITWRWKVPAFLARRATTLKVNSNVSAYSHNNGLRQGF